MVQSRKPAQAPARVRNPPILNPAGFCMTRNSAENYTQRERTIPVGDRGGMARRVSSGNVVRRAAIPSLATRTNLRWTSYALYDGEKTNSSRDGRTAR